MRVMKEKEVFSYDGEVGRWWLKRSLDRAHRRAYRRVADFVRQSFARDPRVIVDYACGPGDLLALLSLRFPRSKLIGVDGSRFMLQRAARRVARLPAGCTGRIELIEKALPDVSILRGRADVAIYCFPNMVPIDGRASRLTANDHRAAEILCRANRPGEEPCSQWALEQGRCVSRNLRRLLNPGGICIRVEYATVKRDELSPDELAYVSFEEGSLDHGVDGIRVRQWFRFVASAYFRSKVLEDVFEQTGDERDRDGGYLITVLRAV